MNIETIATIIIIVCLYEFGYRKYAAIKLEKFIMLRMIKHWLDKEYYIQLGLIRYAINIEYKHGLEMFLVKNTPSEYNKVIYSKYVEKFDIMYYELKDFKNKCIGIIYTDYLKEKQC